MTGDTEVGHHGEHVREAGSVRVTRADLAELPDDGYRYEILDGELFVSAAASVRRQLAVGNLHVLLRASCPRDLLVPMAPLAVGLAEDTEIQPDVLVAARSAFTEADLPEAPLLAVWELVDDRYALAADVGPDDVWTSVRPFEVTVSPAELVE